MIKLILVVCHLTLQQCGVYTTQQEYYPTVVACQEAATEAVLKLTRPGSPLIVKEVKCEGAQDA